MTWSIGVCCQAQCSAAAAASVASPLPHRERWQQPAEIDAGPASLRMIEADAADDLSGRLLDDRPLPVAAQFPLSDHVAGVSGREVETGGRLAQRDLLARDHLGIPEDAHQRLGVRELRQPQHEPPGFDRGRKLVHPGVNLPDVEARDSLIYDRRMQLLTYLNYGGNCAEAFRFYEQHLGGRITMMMKHGEGPDKSQVPPGLKDAVLHARMTIGGTDLLGADVPPDRLSINPRSEHFDADKLQRGIGIRFKGVQRHNVDEYCISEDWVRVQAGRTMDRKGNPLTIKLTGPVEAWYEDLGDGAPVAKA